MFDANAFAGPWIGETMGHDSPAHVWEIKPAGRTLHIFTQWEGEMSVAPAYSATLLAGEPAFVFPYMAHGREMKAVLIDPQHFVIAGWDTNDTRGGIGPDYDVVFSRPGIAELGAQDAYRRFIAEKRSA
jgi:hypothetical protein